MNRAEFMQQLGTLLGDLPVNERTDALKYYADYFDEAGIENEEQVIRELGSPEETAKNIKADIPPVQIPAVKPTEQQKEDQKNNHQQQQNSQTQNQDDHTQNGGGYTPPKNDPWKTAFMVILAILLIPIALPVAIGLITSVFSIIIAIFSIIFSLILGLAVASIAFIAVAVLLGIIASVNLTTIPFASFVLFGLALLFVALGILFMILVILLCGKALPAIFKGIVYVCGRPFRKKEVVV